MSAADHCESRQTEVVLQLWPWAGCSCEQIIRLVRVRGGLGAEGGRRPVRGTQLIGRVRGWRAWTGGERRPERHLSREPAPDLGPGPRTGGPDERPPTCAQLVPTHQTSGSPSPAALPPPPGASRQLRRADRRPAGRRRLQQTCWPCYAIPHAPPRTSLTPPFPFAPGI